MKRIWIALSVAAGVVILGIVAIWVLANPNRYRATIQTQLEKQLGRKVSLGEMSLGLLPLRFQVSNPVVAEDPQIRPQPDFIRAENLDIRIGLISLLQGAIRVDSLELRRPRIELVATPEGQWNFASLSTGAAGETNNAGATAPSKGSSSTFSINRLTIVDGQVGITDLRKGPSRSGYDHIDLTILDYSPAKPFLFDLAAHVQGDTAQEVRLKGTAGPTGAGGMAATPFHGTLNLKQVQIDGLMKFIDTG